jgi:hypothetical protein
MVDELSQHDLPNEQDFTAQINSRMQVPNHLYAQANKRSRFDFDDEVEAGKGRKSKNSPVSKMYLPDTIVVTEGNKYHKGIRLDSLDDDDFPFLTDRFSRGINAIAPAETLTFGDQLQTKRVVDFEKAKVEVDPYPDELEVE